MKFIALKVGSGDAFYLERRESSILFDGGGSEKLFPSLFYKELNKTHVNIIVCSHNDSDHTNGIIGYLKSNYTCDQIWLPALWLARIDTLLTEPETFFSELINEINSKTKLNFKQLEVDTPSDSFKNKEQINIRKLLKHQKTLKPTLLKSYNKRMSKNHYKLFKSFFYTTQRIIEIFNLAHKKGIEVRWFQYSLSKAASGGENYFKPINSYEIKKTYSKQISVLDYLYLTQANKESLVFYSPKLEDISNGILYSADSDYSFKQTIPKDIGQSPIITVPHHGSKHNEVAYQSKQLKPLVSNKNSILVRSDGYYKSRPGIQYKSFKLLKYCTCCNSHSIVLIPKNKNWSSKNPICKC